MQTTKQYYSTDNIGKAKYTVSFHDGVSTHKDGSPFFGIKTFSNLKKKQLFINELKADGFQYKGW